VLEVGLAISSPYGLNSLPSGYCVPAVTQPYWNVFAWAFRSGSSGNAVVSPLLITVFEYRFACNRPCLLSCKRVAQGHRCVVVGNEEWLAVLAVGVPCQY